MGVVRLFNKRRAIIQPKKKRKSQKRANFIRIWNSNRKKMRAVMLRILLIMMMGRLQTTSTKTSNLTKQMNCGD